MKKKLTFRHFKGDLFKILCGISTIIALIVLALLLWDVWNDGHSWINLGFITNFPSRFPERAGIKSAIWGTIWLMILVTLKQMLEVLK